MPSVNFSLLCRVSHLQADASEVEDHFGVSSDDATRILDVGLLVNLTAPKLNYLIHKFGTALELEVPAR